MQNGNKTHSESITGTKKQLPNQKRLTIKIGGQGDSNNTIQTEKLNALTP